MGARRISVILAFALVGRSLCGAIVNIGRDHDVRDDADRACRRRVRTAVVFTAAVVSMDFFLVALLIEHSFAMFGSVLGTWLPFTLIFAATYLTGTYVSRRITLLRPDARMALWRRRRTLRALVR